MTTRIPKNITPKKFAKWLKENTKCEVKVRGQRAEAVVYSEQTGLGRYIPLLARMNDEVLEITEFVNDYHHLKPARTAIENEDEAFAPVPFYDWVQDQYLTARDVKITKIEI